MFSKKMLCTLSIIGLSLVGCSNVEEPVKEEMSEAIKEEKSEVLNEIENVEESTNSYIPNQQESQVESNNHKKKSLRYLHVMIRFLMVPIHLIMKRTWQLKML